MTGTGTTYEINANNKISSIGIYYDANLKISLAKTLRSLYSLKNIKIIYQNKEIGTIEINKNINDLENFGQTYTANNGKKVVIRKSYSLQKEFLRILGKRNEKYKVGPGTIEGRFYIDIYIKDLKANESFIIKRDNISIYYESAGIKLYLPSI